MYLSYGFMILRELVAVAEEAEDASGRSLRKLPLLAHATLPCVPAPCPAFEFLRSMRRAVASEAHDKITMRAE